MDVDSRKLFESLLDQAQRGEQLRATTQGGTNPCVEIMIALTKTLSLPRFPPSMSLGEYGSGLTDKAIVALMTTPTKFGYGAFGHVSIWQALLLATHASTAVQELLVEPCMEHLGASHVLRLLQGMVKRLPTYDELLSLAYKAGHEQDDKAHKKIADIARRHYADQFAEVDRQFRQGQADAESAEIPF